MPPIDTHVGGRIAARRRAAGISIENLASRVGVTPAQLRAYEAGEQRPAANELISLREAFGVPLSYFFEGLSPADELLIKQTTARR